MARSSQIHVLNVQMTLKSKMLLKYVSELA